MNQPQPPRAPYFNVGLTEEEMTEVILLIDDEQGDANEDILKQVRTKMSAKRKALRKRIRDGVYASAS